MTALSLQRVRAELGSREVLHGIDFSVRPGEVLALVGPNGSGKTTALRCCYRALTPTGGAVATIGQTLTAAGFDLSGFTLHDASGL